jgi:hypothetical protein
MPFMRQIELNVLFDIDLFIFNQKRSNLALVYMTGATVWELFSLFIPTLADFVSVGLKISPLGWARSPVSLKCVSQSRRSQA